MSLSAIYTRGAQSDVHSRDYQDPKSNRYEAAIGVGKRTLLGSEPAPSSRKGSLNLRASSFPGKTTLIATGISDDAGGMEEAILNKVYVASM